MIYYYTQRNIESKDRVNGFMLDRLLSQAEPSRAISPARTWD
jgi:hypothetical protein